MALIHLKVSMLCLLSKFRKIYSFLSVEADLIPIVALSSDCHRVGSSFAVSPSVPKHSRLQSVLTKSPDLVQERHIVKL